MGVKGVNLLLILTCTLRLCVAQNGVCYVTASQVSTHSYYVQTSYTYYYDCSNLGWGWSYCAATGYISTLTYASVTAYVAQFTCCTGYTQVGTTQTCAEINECASNGGLGPCQQNCINTIGSFYCNCNPGYTLSGGVFCNDINECAPNGGLGPCQQLCTNTIGSYYCSCQPGYALSADGTSCHDINECAPNGGLGPCQQLCTNTIGSYYCSCQPGYALSANGTSCNVAAIRPTTTSITSVAVLATPSVTLSPSKDAYIQVRLLNVVDCTMWTVPEAQKILYQSIEDKLNGFCSCNVTVTNAIVICYDASSVTIRGNVEMTQLAYLVDWVKMATSINPRGTFLKVDPSCVTQIQSFNDPGCVAASAAATVNAQSAAESSIGLPVGLAIGVLTVLLVTIGIVVIIVWLIKTKKSRASRTINPLYSPSDVSIASRDDENPYDTVQDSFQVQPDNQNLHAPLYFNTKL